MFEHEEPKEPRGEYCPKHPTVPFMQYGGLPWCRMCETNRHRLLEVYRKWLSALQWGLVLSLPFLVLALCTLAPVRRDARGALPQEFWWILLVPSTFLASCIATCLGRTLIQVYDTVGKKRLRLLTWFHPTHMLRDWVAIAACLTIPYGVLLYLGQNVEGFGAAGRQEGAWWFTRAPLLVAAGMLSIQVLDRANWITRDTLVPQKGRFVYLLTYGVLLVGAARLLSSQLLRLALMKPAMGWLMVPGAITAFCVLMSIVVVLAIRVRAQAIGKLRNGPVPATIAMVGPSNVGKTVFLTRAYSLMSRGNYGKLVTLEQTKESKRALSHIVEKLERDREWPLGSVVASHIPFSLNYGIKEIIRFDWLDLPGAAFTHGDFEDYADFAEEFDRQLVNADAVAMLVDATDLSMASEIRNVGSEGGMLYGHIYFEVARKLYKRLEAAGTGTRPVPLAIIITKSCLVPTLQRLKLRTLVQPLVEYWQSMASESNLKVPEVRVYLSSAVITQGKNDPPPPTGQLHAQECVEPVLWLASQVLRANIGLTDVSTGFWKGGSPLQETIIRLEASSR